MARTCHQSGENTETIVRFAKIVCRKLASTLNRFPDKMIEGTTSKHHSEYRNFVCLCRMANRPSNHYVLYFQAQTLFA